MEYRVLFQYNLVSDILENNIKGINVDSIYLFDFQSIKEKYFNKYIFKR